MIFLLIGQIIIIGIYLRVSVIKKSLIHGLSFLLFGTEFSLLPASIWAMSHESFFIYSIPSSAYLWVTFLYVLAFAMISSGYVRGNSVKGSLFKVEVVPRSVDSKKAMGLGLLFGLFGLILLNHLYSTLGLKIGLSNPRLMYDYSRDGYGKYYFVSDTAFILSYTLLLFTKKIFRGQNWIILSSFVFAGYLFGSKAVMLQFIMIYLMYSYLRGYIPWAKSFVYASVSVAALILAFGLYSLGNSGGVLATIVGYSNYVRDYVIFVRYFPYYFSGHTWGANLLQGLIWPVVPRFLDGNKPLYFSVLLIPLKLPLFNKATLMNQGAPSFGPFASSFYDFGYLSAIWIAITSYMTGLCLRYSEMRFRTTGSYSFFLIYLYFVGLGVISVGVGNILIPNLILAFLMGLLVRSPDSIHNGARVSPVFISKNGKEEKL